VPVEQFVSRPGILDLSWGHPRPSLLPVEAWALASASASRTYGWRQLTYGSGAGPAPLLEWLTAHTGDATEAQTFVTGGASHGLALVTELLTGPGDVVLVEAPTYHLAFRILTARGATLVPVTPPTVAGTLARLRAEGRRVPLMYLVPTFANPTGASLGDAGRRELVETAVREGLTLVEDDTYRELWYDDPAPPALWRLSGGENVIRLGTFAKTVAPGLRLGWINAAPPYVRQLTSLGYVDSGGGVNHATALTMAAFAASGAYDAHLAAIRRAYRRQRDALAGALGVAAPAGGWFLWLATEAALLPAAEAHGTSFVPGTRFYCDGSGGHDRIRLSFSMLSPAELTEAAARLTAARDESPTRR
jgi:2-aminoadipate transaminase